MAESKNNKFGRLSVVAKVDLDGLDYLEFVNKFAKAAVEDNVEATAQEIAELIAECSIGARADYLDEEIEAQEFAKEMVVEEIRGVIKERVKTFKSIQKLEKLIKAITERKLSDPKEIKAIIERVNYFKREIENLKKGLSQKVIEENAKIEGLQEEKEELEKKLELEKKKYAKNNCDLPAYREIGFLSDEIKVLSYKIERKTELRDQIAKKIK